MVVTGCIEGRGGEPNNDGDATIIAKSEDDGVDIPEVD